MRECASECMSVCVSVPSKQATDLGFLQPEEMLRLKRVGGVGWGDCGHGGGDYGGGDCGGDCDE